MLHEGALKLDSNVHEIGQAWIADATVRWALVCRHHLISDRTARLVPGWSNRLESDRQASVQDELALFSQRRVASSVQPGTAKRGTATSWLGTITCWCLRGRDVQCTGAASAKGHRAINKTKDKTDRIGFPSIIGGASDCGRTGTDHIRHHVERRSANSWGHRKVLERSGSKGAHNPVEGCSSGCRMSQSSGRLPLADRTLPQRSF